MAFLMFQDCIEDSLTGLPAKRRYEMSGTIWKTGGTKKFEFGSGDKGEYLFGGALAIIIIGALSLTVYYTFLGGGEGGTKVFMQYQCEKCKAEFPVDPTKYPRLMDAETPGDQVLDCPKCGVKKSAWPMTKCPACDKYYVRPSFKAKTGKPDICPFCNAEYLKALREKVEKM
jgi:DNA-directed RNA polymerase subunit RPC12/RpoP